MDGVRPARVCALENAPRTMELIKKVGGDVDKAVEVALENGKRARPDIDDMTLLSYRHAIRSTFKWTANGLPLIEPSHKLAASLMATSIPSEITAHGALETSPWSTFAVTWWPMLWPGRPVKQPRLAVLHWAVNSTPRPSHPDETIAYGYMNLNKLHDREPEAILRAIESQDPTFFDTYPRAEGTDLDDAFKKAAIGEAMKAFYRHGLSAYGKPGLRKKPIPTGTPLTAL